MDHQGHAGQAGLSEEQERRVARDGGIGVQHMEADAAPVRVEDRVGPQVVEVNGHPGQQQKGHPPAVFREEGKGNGQGEREVDPIMDQRPKHPRAVAGVAGSLGLPSPH